MRKIVENIGVIFLVVAVTLGLGYSVWETVIRDEPVNIVHNSLIRLCEREQQKSLLDQQFALEAAKARRRNAETASTTGDKITADNEIATARNYERIAQGYKELTPVNCESAFPRP